MDPIEFEKQFKNLGIDKDQILKAGQEIQEDQNRIEEKKTQEISSQGDYEILKRKLDYMTNSIFPKIQDNFNELEQRIEQLKSENTNYKRDITQLKNQVQELQKRLMSARVVFEEDNNFNTIKQDNTISGSAGVAQASSNNSNNNNDTPENVRIDKIFNFSNHKF